VITLVRRLLAYLPASPGGVREAHNVIAADDRLLSILGGRDIEQARALTGDPLVRLMFAWRMETDSPTFRAGA
jgi:hypothetical protein